MTPLRVRAAALAIALTAVLGAACSTSGTDSGSLPTVGTPAPNSPPGSLPGDTLPAAGTVPPPSGDAGACTGAPYELAVRTASGEERTVSERSSWAMYVPNASTWLIVTGDVDLPAESVRTALPDPAGQSLVLLRVTSTTAAAATLPLEAGDTFQPSGAGSPDGRPVVDLQVRTAAGQPPSTGPLTGTLTVDAVTSEGLCLSVDLRREDGAQAKGKIAAPFLSVNASALTS